MRYKQWFFIVIITLVMMGIVPGAIQAQEWSDSQKSVWSDVKNYWKMYTIGDADGMLSYFHKDYLGWDMNDPLPGAKAETEKGLKHFLKSNSIVMYSIKPVGIRVHGNFAVVHYYYQMLIKNAEGKENSSSGRWTDILMKKGDKWMLVGDAGGRSEN